MPGALSATADVTRRARACVGRRLRDAFTFMPWLLTSGGPDNGRAPSRTDGTQIAYGVDSRVQNLIALAGRSDDGSANGAGQLAGMTAGWFFGANAGETARVRPRDGRHDRRDRRGRHRQPGTPARSPRSTACSPCSRSTRTPPCAGSRPSRRAGAGRRGHAVRPGRGRHARCRRHGRGPEGPLDRRGPVRRLRLRRSRGPGQREARPRRPPALTGDPGLRSPARTARHAPRSEPGTAHSARSGRTRSAPRATLPRRALSCRGRWTRPCPPRRTPSRCARRQPPATSPGWTPSWSSHSSPGSCSAARDTAPLSCGARHGRCRHATVTVPGAGPAQVLEYDGEGTLLARSSVRTAEVRVRIAPGGVTLVRR